MPKAFFKNIHPTVRHQGKQPGEVFQLEVDDEGNPAELYWRNRMAEGNAIARYDPAASSGPASEADAPPKAKKGK